MRVGQLQLKGTGLTGLTGHKGREREAGKYPKTAHCPTNHTEKETVSSRETH